MAILFTGKGSAGSWQCRGVQLGGAVGAVRPLASLQECRAADLIVVVKRINHEFFDNVRRSGTPWVWDLVDFYPQPRAGKWSRAQAIQWVRDQIKKAGPNGIIYPNAKMAEDIGIPGAVIYHHARDLPAIPVRENVKLVGYEGSSQYLGAWRERIAHECKRRRWKFVEGAPINQLDIVVAFRDGVHNGYVQSHWKSNVKLANAHGTGTPFVGQPEPGYLETATGLEQWVNNPGDLAGAFDALAPMETRQRVFDAFRANTYTLESRAAQLREYLAGVLG